MADSLCYADIRPLGIKDHAMYMYSYAYPYGQVNRNGDILMNNYTTSYAVSCNETISGPKVINLPAYGLRHSEILVKEVDGVLTVKNKAGVTGYCATVDKKYALKNVKLNSSTLSLGVLTLEFVDTENVVNHTVKEV
jgi:hypothetical protein